MKGLAANMAEVEKTKAKEGKEQELAELHEANKAMVAKMTIDDLSFDSIFTDTTIPKDKQLERLNNRLRTFFLYDEVNEKGETVEKTVDQKLDLEELNLAHKRMLDRVNFMEIEKAGTDTKKRKAAIELVKDQ